MTFNNGQTLTLGRAWIKLGWFDPPFKLVAYKFIKILTKDAYTSSLSKRFFFLQFWAIC